VPTVSLIAPPLWLNAPKKFVPEKLVVQKEDAQANLLCVCFVVYNLLLVEF
jgi:hypothetical protein